MGRRVPRRPSRARAVPSPGGPAGPLGPAPRADTDPRRLQRVLAAHFGTGRPASPHHGTVSHPCLPLTAVGMPLPSSTLRLLTQSVYAQSPLERNPGVTGDIASERPQSNRCTTTGCSRRSCSPAAALWPRRHIEFRTKITTRSDRGKGRRAKWSPKGWNIMRATKNTATPTERGTSSILSRSVRLWSCPSGLPSRLFSDVPRPYAADPVFPPASCSFRVIAYQCSRNVIPTSYFSL